MRGGSDAVGGGDPLFMYMGTEYAFAANLSEEDSREFERRFLRASDDTSSTSSQETQSFGSSDADTPDPAGWLEEQISFIRTAGDEFREWAYNYQVPLVRDREDWWASSSLKLLRFMSALFSFFGTAWANFMRALCLITDVSKFCVGVLLDCIYAFVRNAGGLLWLSLRHRDAFFAAMSILAIACLFFNIPLRAILTARDMKPSDAQRGSGISSTSETFTGTMTPTGTAAPSTWAAPWARVPFAVKLCSIAVGLACTVAVTSGVPSRESLVPRKIFSYAARLCFVVPYFVFPRDYSTFCVIGAFCTLCAFMGETTPALRESSSSASFFSLVVFCGGAGIRRLIGKDGFSEPEVFGWSSTQVAVMANVPLLTFILTESSFIAGVKFASLNTENAISKFGRHRLFRTQAFVLIHCLGAFIGSSKKEVELSALVLALDLLLFLPVPILCLRSLNKIRATRRQGHEQAQDPSQSSAAASRPESTPSDRGARSSAVQPSAVSDSGDSTTRQRQRRIPSNSSG